MKRLYPDPLSIEEKDGATVTTYAPDWKVFRYPGFACSLCREGCDILRRKRSIPACVRLWALEVAK